MLAFSIRRCCIAALFGVLACHNAPPNKPAQMSGASEMDDADGGEPEDEDAGSSRPVSVGNTRRPEAGAGGRAAAASNAAGKGGAGGKGAAGAGGAVSAHAGAGGASGSQAGAGGNKSDDGDGEAGSGAEPDDNDKDKAGSDAPTPMGGAGGTGGARNPLDVLWDLARMTPQGMGADVIRRYLEALGSGDAPAASTAEFLRAIDAEAHCSENLLSTQCLAACQTVARTCAVCLVNEDCRAALLDVCGVGALACR